MFEKVVLYDSCICFEPHKTQPNTPHPPKKGKKNSDIYKMNLPQVGQVTVTTWKSNIQKHSQLLVATIKRKQTKT